MYEEDENMERERELKHHLFIDADEDSWFLKSGNPLWTNAEMVEIEARRLMGLFPKLRYMALIFRSDNGWHLIFNKSRLTWPEMVAALCESRIEHHGHRHFSILLADDTLRVSKKPGKTSSPPRLWKVLHLG